MTRTNDLDALDDFLAGTRRLLDRPGYRRRFMADLGYAIAPSTLRAVRAVDRLARPGPFIGDVAESLVIDASTATRFVDQASKEGYLEKVPDLEDQRRVALRLTPEGKELLGQVDRVRRSLLEEVTKDWSSEHLQRLASMLDRLSENLQSLDE